MAVLTLQHQTPVFKLGYDHDSTGVNEVFAGALTPIWQANRVAPGVKKTASENVFGIHRCFIQVDMVDVIPIDWAWALRHVRRLNR